MYDPARQARDAAGFVPRRCRTKGLLYFAYPRHTAVAYVPLSHLPYRLSYALHTLLMVRRDGRRVPNLVRPMAAARRIATSS